MTVYILCGVYIAVGLLMTSGHVLLFYSAII